MGKKIGSWCGAAACVAAAVVVLAGCAPSIDLLIVNTTDEAIEVYVEPGSGRYAVEANSYHLQERGMSSGRKGDWVFQIYSPDDQLLGKIHVPQYKVYNTQLDYENLYILMVTPAALRTD